MTAEVANQFLAVALLISQALLGLALCFSAYRLFRGPRAQDRVTSIDSLYINAALLVITVGIRTGSTMYFEAALIIAFVSFASTSALAKFLMRGEVIE